MSIRTGDIITVPHVENHEIDPLILAFDALADENGDPDSMLGRRMMMVDMVSTVRLFAASDKDMDTPILVLQVPVGGMTMGLLEDLCLVAIAHHAYSFNVSPPPSHDAWDYERVLDAVHLRPAYQIDPMIG